MIAPRKCLSSHFLLHVSRTPHCHFHIYNPCNYASSTMRSPLPTVIPAPQHTNIKQPVNYRANQDSCRCHPCTFSQQRWGYPCRDGRGIAEPIHISIAHPITVVVFHHYISFPSRSRVLFPTFYFITHTHIDFSKVTICSRHQPLQPHPPAATQDHPTGVQ